MGKEQASQKGAGHSQIYQNRMGSVAWQGVTIAAGPKESRLGSRIKRLRQRLNPRDYLQLFRLKQALQ